MRRQAAAKAVFVGVGVVAFVAGLIGFAEQAAPVAAAARGAQGPAPAGGAPGGGGARRGQPQVANVVDLQQMLAALPDTAPAVPKQPRRVLVLAKAAGFVHASIPLATRTIEALGNRTRAWDTVITYNPADITEANLRQYDAVFLASTTGMFLDDPNDAAATAARRKALLDFIRAGKGIAGIHAATDAYHGGDGPGGGAPLWPEFDRLIGGYFKWHWNFPTQVVLKVEDVSSPINAPFTQVNVKTGVRTARAVSIVDEIYAFNQDSWSRDRSHVLLSIDYAKMPEEVKKREPAPQRTDQDYALSYIQREGNGRVFVTVLGHDESIYKMRPILEHVLAGVQYAIGDLPSDDTPSNALKK